MKTKQQSIKESLKEGESFAFFRSADELVIGVCSDFDEEFEEHIIFTAKKFEVSESIFKKKQRKTKEKEETKHLNS